MKLSWIKDYKYYRLSLQNNLFGTTDVICSWGSIISNQNGFKVISCQTQEDIETAVQYIIKRRKARGYTLLS
ncbi:MAG: WGR domain-containing protein [Rickettsia endosymbiont of Bryobia graminum]|nr:WGR domain-containing protein [Rickettsia endosymbiont of Bryobia graminum]